LIEYDLAYESLKSIKGQDVADFIDEHSVDQNSDESCNLVSICPWKLFFDGTVCREGQGVGIVLISPKGAIFEQLVRLEYFYTNNQAEYEAILLGLQILSSMGVKHVEAFGDPLLVMQQIACTFQCLDGSLNAYPNKCLEIIYLFDDFTVQHVSRDENIVANDLAKQASGFRSNQGKFGFLEKPDVLVYQTGQSGLPNHQFVLVAMDYFTKCMEAVPLKNMTHRGVIHFISEHIISRFGVPQTLTLNQGLSIFPILHLGQWSS
jgi:ribonuclease HI